MTYRYRTAAYSDVIEKVKIERETDKSVWVLGRSLGTHRHAKVSTLERYWDTWAQAKQYLIDKINANIKHLESKLAHERSILKGLEMLPDEDDT